MVLPPKMDQAIRLLPLGDYCLIDSLGRNMDMLSFREILEGVTEVSEEVVDVTPSAPVVEVGTYRPFLNNLNEAETLPRKRQLPGNSDAVTSG